MQALISYCYPYWQIVVDAAIKKNPLIIDFSNGKYQHRYIHAIKTKDALVKAIGYKKNCSQLSVIDATAGLAFDAFTLSSLGCHVTMVERNKSLAILLCDAIYRYKASYEKDISIFLHHGDAKHYLNNLPLSAKVDVIYLDPMYPQPKRSKISLNQSQMRIIRHLVGNDEDIKDLLAIALKTAQQRVVIKRPKSACYLANVTPSFSIGEKNHHRFDVYMTSFASFLLPAS